MRTTVNLGNYENVVIEIDVEDKVRPEIDANTKAAVTRVYDMVEGIVADKARKFSK